ncbi:small subunit ribosomal protein S6 [Thermosulfidibacter takaii ABI70S6]|uniref:Small ribosomal subunit protein bS6 n=1 Tax=Thermosulfidibacter takaii (strain DSM 17441 / JCM 13301 / NBRC 103674 / ABI70S6) TaxID=1298851 RepID=A0A0S3QVU9_THET7|nr:30S ribosomal protein S6 [Thermosulfidibacter takaii]BAT72452.1 small subunit ribosomal protein S6 [Thermosulfidibacter takaii ABI70S6]
MEKRCYESVVVFTPDLTEQEQEEQIKWVKELIAKNDGQLLKVDVWGKRKLAYEIEKKKEGYYVLFLFWGTPYTVEGMEKAYRINHNILRYLTVKRKDKECEKEEPKEQ